MKYYKALILIVALLLLSLNAAARKLTLSAQPTLHKLTQNTDSGFELCYQIGELHIEEIETQHGRFSTISVDDYGFTTDVGMPRLPMQRHFIWVPMGAKVSYEIASQKKMHLDAQSLALTHPILPAQEPVAKNQDIASIPFAYNIEAYKEDSYIAHPSIQINELGFLRGVRLFELEFYPLSYNPFSAELQIIHHLELKVTFENADLASTQDMLERTASYEFERMYQNIILNWRSDERTALQRHPTKMVILTPSAYVNTLQPFIQWKTMQGFEVILTTVGSGANVANNSSAIKNYMQGLWNSATAQNPAPSYLLIVGDTASSGNNIIAATGQTSSAHVTDLTYVRLNGTDYLPEMYFGRFSVSNATELNNIIQKSITFEKTLMSDLNYLGKSTLIAGVDSYWAPTHGNGQINYATTHYFNTANSILTDSYLYPASGNSRNAILNNANQGRGYINYTAHGSETSWADPLFNVNDVNSMTNYDRYGVMVGNCCITNKFNHGAPCFGEVVIRKANAGGVAYIGGTNNTYWDEDFYWQVGYKTPQTAAHAYNAARLGALDAMFHSHNESVDKWASTVSETIYMGNAAVQQSGSSRSNYYWEVYMVMGDPSLMPYLKVPDENLVSFPSSITTLATSVSITATPQSRVAISKDGVLHGSAIVPASGSLNLSFTPFESAGNASLVFTAQNKITRIEDVTIISANEPVISVNDIVYKDANNNIPEYNESGSLNFSIQNIGNAAATNLNLSLSCHTAGITISSAQQSYAYLASGGSHTFYNAFGFDVADDIPDGLEAEFSLNISSSGLSWIHDFSIVFAAVNLSLGDFVIQDNSGNGNGAIDPGEEVTLSIPISNLGSASSSMTTVSLSCDSPEILISNPNITIMPIPAGSQSIVEYLISASAELALGSKVNFLATASSGAYTAQSEYEAAIGAPSFINIGTGGSSTGISTGSPINVYYKSLHGQSVYLASELSAAGLNSGAKITQIGFFVNSSPSLGMPNFVVRIGHTSASNVSSWISSGLNQHFHASIYHPTNTGWNMITLDEPFEYNGIENIVIDTAFGMGTSTSSSGTIRFSSTPSGYRFVRSDSSNQTNVFSGGSSSSQRPNLRLAYFENPSSPPSINLSSNTLHCSLIEGEVGSKSFSITNSGGSTLDFHIQASSVDWLSFPAQSGSIPAGENQSFTAHFSAIDIPVGSHETSLNITCNDPSQSILELAVSLEISPQYLQLSIQKSSDGISLSWQDPGFPATFEIYSSRYPYEDYSLIANTSELYWVDSEAVDRAFYILKVIRINPH